MISARIQAMIPPPNPIPNPTAAQIDARRIFRQMIPSAAPKNKPTKPMTVGNISTAAHWNC